METIADTAKNQGKPLYCCLIDLRKAFDSINRRTLYETMREAGVDPETVAMLGEMCNSETSSLLLNNRETRPFKIQKGVRQGGISSPVCFNIIPEMLSRELHTKPDCGMRIPGYPHRINHLFYADDLILFGKDNEQLRVLVRATINWANKYKLTINNQKTEAIALNTTRTPRIFIDN